ncbi:hypothetical protein HpEKA34_01920 [Helicobacter pylori]
MGVSLVGKWAINVEDFIRDFIDREPQAKEPQTREPQAPREPIRDFYDYGYSFGHAW